MKSGSGIDGADILPLLVLGVVNTGFGCLLYFTSIGSIDAQTVAICDYIEPASAVLFSMALLGETSEAEEMLGMVLIAAGVLVSNRDNIKRALGGRVWNGSIGHRCPKWTLLACRPISRAPLLSQTAIPLRTDLSVRTGGI